MSTGGLTRNFIAILIAFLIGAGCRWFRIPVPAPPRLIGALLVLAVTVGYIMVDRLDSARRNTPPQPVGITKGR